MFKDEFSHLNTLVEEIQIEKWEVCGYSEALTPPRGTFQSTWKGN